MQDPTLEQLECLITWPKGSKGEQHERNAIAVLLELCKQHGYGRIPQLAKQIEQVWRNPECVERFQKIKDDQLAYMNRRLDELVRESQEMGLYDG